MIETIRPNEFIDELKFGYTVKMEGYSNSGLTPFGSNYFLRGIKRVGPRTALKLVKKHGGIEAVLEELGQGIENLQEIKDFFLYPEVTSEYQVAWRSPNEPEIIELLCRRHDFSEARVKGAVDRLVEASDAGQQTLDQWF